MIGYLVSRRVFDREPIRISCIELSIMNQKANMKKLYVILIMLGGLSAQNSILKQFSDQFADIAEKANPAVVTILTEKKIDLSQSHRNLPQDNDLFRFFFNQPRIFFFHPVNISSCKSSRTTEGINHSPY